MTSVLETQERDGSKGQTQQQPPKATLVCQTSAGDDVREPLDYDVFGSLHHFAETLLKKKIKWVHPYQQSDRQHQQ